MRRREENHLAGPERWMVSYADFLTLLFAFFVVMYAVSRSTHAQPKDISESVKRALGEQPPAATAAAAAVPGKQGTDLAPSYTYLREQLRQEIEDGRMQVSMDSRGIVISLREKAFFPSGEDTIYPSAYGSMAKVAEVIGNLSNGVRLEGHTDSVPIHNGRFRSNWDLSAARSIAVLSWFESHSGISAERFAIAGYASNRPVAENDSEEGRAQNRRVEIVILDAAAERAGL